MNGWRWLNQIQNQIYILDSNCASVCNVFKAPYRLYRVHGEHVPDVHKLLLVVVVVFILVVVVVDRIEYDH